MSFQLKDLRQFKKVFVNGGQMISNARLSEIDSFLDHATNSLAPKLFTFHKALKIAGFNNDIATELVKTMLLSVMAVPSPAEQPLMKG